MEKICWEGSQNPRSRIVVSVEEVVLFIEYKYVTKKV